MRRKLILFNLRTVLTDICNQQRKTAHKQREYTKIVQNIANNDMENVLLILRIYQLDWKRFSQILYIVFLYI